MRNQTERKEGADTGEALGVCASSVAFAKQGLIGKLGGKG